MLRIWYVMLLLITTVSLCGAQTPKGQLIEQADGSYDYIVDNDDRVGQWGIAFSDPTLWQELVRFNPQLDDADLIRPGDRLNVPPSMLRLFRFMIGGHNLATTKTDTVRVPKVVYADLPADKMADWLIGLLLVAVAWVMYKFGLERAKRDNDNRRKVEDPYYGPDRVEGGLPTVEAAVAYFTNMYENERLAMSVQETRFMPPLVHITRIVAVDVKGPMLICYGESNNPVEKNIPDWTPAWQCFLDDGGSFYLSLMRCGNDVRGGHGMTPLSKDQIRPRQDMKVVEVNQQVWPVVTEEESVKNALEKVTMSADAQPYREVRITSPNRFVLLPHDDGQARIIDVSDFGTLARLSLIGGQVVVEVGDKMQVIGQVCEKDPLKAGTDAENLSLINAGPPTTPTTPAHKQDNAGGLVD